METLGIRHVALNVRDAQKSKEFYMKVFGMQLEWEPDPDNVYLTNGGQDNLAIHKAAEDVRLDLPGALDHFGMMVPRMEDVDTWYKKVTSFGVKIAKEIKTHRDGARSFYMADPDGNIIQVIYHPPISRRAQVDHRTE